MSGSIPKVHVLTHHGIGDVLMAVPMLKALYEYLGGAKLAVTVKGELQKQILIRYGFEGCMILPLSTFNGTWFRKVRYGVKILIWSPDATLVTYGVNTKVALAFKLLSPLGRLLGFPEGIERILYSRIGSQLQVVHKIDLNLILARAVVPSSKPAKFPRFPMEKPESLQEMDTNRMTIALAPGSGSNDVIKRWPPQHFTQLMGMISAVCDCQFLLLGDSEEWALCEHIKNLAGPNVGAENLAGRYSLFEIAYILAHSDLVIANCNGLSHVAFFSGVRVVGIYGATNPRVTGIYKSEASIIIENKDLGVSKHIPGKGYGDMDPEIMVKIAPEFVFSKIENLLS